jgi:tetratricopeptide (TPR) repeat protein
MSKVNNVFFDIKDKLLNKTIKEFITTLNFVSKGTLLIVIYNNEKIKDKIIYFMKKLEYENILDSNLDLLNNNVSYKNKKVLNVYLTDSTFNDENKKNQFLQYINLYRDSFVNSSYIYVIWIKEYMLNDIITRSPDFWRVRTLTFEFKTKLDFKIEKYEYYQNVSDSENNLIQREQLLETILDNLPVENEHQEIYYSKYLSELMEIKIKLFKFNELQNITNKILNKVVINKNKDLTLFIKIFELVSYIANGDINKYKEEEKKILNEVENITNDNYKASIYELLSNNNIVIEKFNQSLIYINKAINIYKNYDDVINLCNSHVIKSRIFSNMNEKIQSKEMLDESLKYCKLVNNLKLEALIHLNLCNYYLDTNQIEFAIDEINKVKELNKNIKNENIGNDIIKANAKINYYRGNYEESKKLLLESISLSSKYNDNFGIINNFLLLIKICLNNKDYEQAITYISKIDEIKKKIHMKPYLENIDEILTTLKNEIKKQPSS